MITSNKFYNMNVLMKNKESLIFEIRELHIKCSQIYVIQIGNSILYPLVNCSSTYF